VDDRHAVEYGWGGVADILMGTAAVSIYAYRTLVRSTLVFMLPAMFLSLGVNYSEPVPAFHLVTTAT